MAEVSTIYGRDYQGGSQYQSRTKLGSDTIDLIAANNYNGNSWVVVIDFTLTEYAKNLVFSWCTGSVDYGSGYLKYKVSNTLSSTYTNATYNTGGEDGTIWADNYQYRRNAISLSGTYAPGTYYLYIWPAANNTGTSIYWQSPGSYRAYMSYTAYAPLSTLSASNGTLGEAQTLTITSYDSSFRHSIRYDCGDTSAAIVTKVTDRSISFTPSVNLARENKTGTTVSITFTLYTFSGDTELGTTTKKITCAIPASVAPICELSVSDAMGYADTFGGYIQNKSRLEIIAEASYSNENFVTDITAYTVTADGKTYNYSDIETTPIANSGTLTISATVRDARSRTGSASKNITVLPYVSPVISKLAVHRCNSDGTENATGSYTKVTYSFEITSLSSKNAKTIKLKYKKTSATSYTEVALPSAYSATDATYIFAAADDSSYDVQISVADSFVTTTRSTTVSTAAVLMHWGADGKSIAFGKIAEKSESIEFGWTQYDKFGALQGNGLAAYTGGGDNGIDPDTTLEELCLTSHSHAPQGLGTFYYIHTAFYNTKSATAARSQIAFPYNKSGSMYHRYYASGAWSNWVQYMNANDVASAISAASADLDKVWPVGSYYISANETSPASIFGGTWHRIESRFLWGSPAGSTLGATAGEQTHKLTIAEMPSHSHTSKGWAGVYDGAGSYVTLGGQGYSDAYSTNATGGGGAHNNMPPYVTCAIWRREA